MLSTCERYKSFHKEFMEIGDYIGYKCFDESKNIRYIKLSLYEESFKLNVCFKNALKNATSLYNTLLTENFILINNCLIQCSFKLDDQPNLDKARDLLQLIYEHYNYSFPGIILQDMHNYTGMKFKIPTLSDLCEANITRNQPYAESCIMNKNITNDIKSKIICSMTLNEVWVEECMNNEGLPDILKMEIYVKYAGLIKSQENNENTIQIGR